MLASVRTSANGRPSLRAKRARSRSRLVLESASAISGRDDRDEFGGVGLVSDHTLSYDGIWTKVHFTL